MHRVLFNAGLAEITGGLTFCQEPLKILQQHDLEVPLVTVKGSQLNFYFSENIYLYSLLKVTLLKIQFSVQ